MESPDRLYQGRQCCSITEIKLKHSIQTLPEFKYDSQIRANLQFGIVQATWLRGLSIRIAIKWCCSDYLPGFVSC